MGNMRRLSVVAFAFASTITAGWAAEYPDHPIRFIVPQAAGSATDTVARILGAELGKELDQTFVIDDRPGGALTVGLDLVAKSPPDGYTIGMGPIGALAINRHMVAKLPYDIEHDFQPIALVARGHLLLAVSPMLPVTSVKELIDYAKKNPGKLSNASSSSGSPGHVGGELFKFMTGTEIVHVPYRGGSAAITDLMAGHVDIMFESLQSIAPFARDGKVRALGVSGAKRSPAFPDADHRRDGARLSGADVDRRHRAGRRAAAHRRQAQRGDQQGPHDRRLQDEIRRHRRRAGRRHAGGFRANHQGRLRQMGGCDQTLRRQARLIRPVSVPPPRWLG
jgi:tripartite-type tricarboxylate transporter receptor subunit TctC